jgi:drug/metabolite transporter (DMT)-like permease
MLVIYALVWLLLANIGSQWGVTHMEAGRSSIIIILELITAVMSATWVAGETMSAVEWMGGALIMMAAFIEAFRTKDDELPLTTID